MRLSEDMANSSQAAHSHQRVASARGRLPSLMAEPTNATPKEKRWLMAFRGLRPVQEAVIVVILGFLIGIIAVGIVHFML
jgi:hypothetical protein